MPIGPSMLNAAMDLQNPRSIFAGSSFGVPDISNVKQSSTTNPNAPPSDKLNDGEIAGIVVGSVVGWFVAMLLGVLITICVIKRHMKPKTAINADVSSAEAVPGSPVSPTKPGGLFNSIRRKQQAAESRPLAASAI